MSISTLYDYVQSLLNPILYDGSFRREIEENYKTNELGFLIGVSFTAFAAWTFVWSRRTRMRNMKKR